MNDQRVPASELSDRMQRLRLRLDRDDPDWQLAIIMRPLSIFYLTGTLASGVLWIRRDRPGTLFVRRGYQRAVDESQFAETDGSDARIEPIRSFRDIAAVVGPVLQRALIEKDGLSLALFELFTKYFDIEQYDSLDIHLNMIRAVKSDYEIERVERAGAIHQEVLEQLVPDMLRSGISEAQLAAEMYKAMLDCGGHAAVRFNSFPIELPIGYVCFGTSSLCSNSFDGPDGVIGLCPAVPSVGSHDRHLQSGDLVFIDVGCNFEGYHTDKTSVYSFGGPPPEVALHAHQQCVAIQDAAAKRLRPGEIPSNIYESIIAELDDTFLEHFMGYGDQQVRFLGHGSGLFIDELPVIARGFDYPLEENMVISLEPKKGLPGIGMVGVENSFVVTENGGRSVTGNRYEIIECR